MKHNFNKNTSIPFKGFFKKAAGVSLSPEEKAAGLEKLRAFMDTTAHHPVKTYREFGFVSFFSSLSKKQLVPVYGLFFCLVLGAGTSLAAEGSLPGSTLYPVKIHLNEGVRGLLAFGSKMQAQVSAQLATTRIQEAEKLATVGSLTPADQVQLEKSFSDSADNVTLKVSALDNAGDATEASSISNDFKAILEKNHSRLIDLSNSTDGNEKSRAGLVHIAETVSSTIDKIDKHSEKRRANAAKYAAPSASPVINLNAATTTNTNGSTTTPATTTASSTPIIQLNLQQENTNTAAVINAQPQSNDQAQANEQKDNHASDRGRRK